MTKSAESNDVNQALWGVIMNAINGDHSAQSIASAVRASFDVRPRGTVTPPADDVREALAEVEWYVHGGVGRRDHWEWLGHAGADAVMRKFEVRPRGTVTDAEVERSCEIMHDAYEAAAAVEGWSTQEASRKPWDGVPEANKRTMRIAVRALLEARS